MYSYWTSVPFLIKGSNNWLCALFLLLQPLFSLSHTLTIDLINLRYILISLKEYFILHQQQDRLSRLEGRAISQQQ